MSKMIVWSDLHLGHKNVCKFRPFDTSEEHDETLFDALAIMVNKRDCLYLLGDVAFDYYWLQALSEIQCIKKVLVLGNHDTESKKGRLHIKDLAPAFDEIHGLLSKSKCWFSHAPIHPNELRGRINIHGHVHPYSVDDPRYVNVCPENTNWKPVVYQDIKGWLDKNPGKVWREQ